MKKNKFLAVILAVAVAVGAAGVTTYAVGKDANDTEAPSAVATAASASDTEAVKDETVYVMTAAARGKFWSATGSRTLCPPRPRRPSRA